jgi:hypothetical protein
VTCSYRQSASGKMVWVGLIIPSRFANGTTRHGDTLFYKGSRRFGTTCEYGKQRWIEDRN